MGMGNGNVHVAVSKVAEEASGRGLGLVLCGLDSGLGRRRGAIEHAGEVGGVALELGGGGGGSVVESGSESVRV